MDDICQSRRKKKKPGVIDEQNDESQLTSELVAKMILMGHPVLSCHPGS